MSLSHSAMEVAQSSIQEIMSPVRSANGHLFGFTKEKLYSGNLLGLWSHFFRRSLRDINIFLDQYFVEGPKALKNDFPQATRNEEDLSNLVRFCDIELKKLIG